MKKSIKLLQLILNIYSLYILSILLLSSCNLNNSDNTIIEIVNNKITPSSSTNINSFGYSVDINDTFAMVGAPSKYHTGKSNIFMINNLTNNWEELIQLSVSNSPIDNFFGESVSMTNDYIIVGASGTGNAYIINQDSLDSTYVKLVSLIASGSSSSDYFGCAVSIYGNYAIVGAYGDQTHGAYTGCAYIFERNISSNQWEEVSKLIADDGDGGDRFGVSVAISENYAVVGAPRDDNENGYCAGSAYIYQRDENGWSQIKKITASDGTNFDWFGCSVDISGNNIVIGAWGNSSAYLFNNDNNEWKQLMKLEPSDKGNFFGYSVAICEDNIIIGDYGDDYNGNLSGCAYHFNKSDKTGLWEQVVKIIAEDAEALDEFGYSVGLSEKYAIIGAESDNKGSAYIYIF
jgi:hypothetical protein